MKINIIGSGNVASHLAQQLSKSMDILSVYSRNPDHAQMLTDKVGGEVVLNFDDLPPAADLTIVAVKDDALSEVVRQIPLTYPVVHTSGSIGLEVFEGFEHFGVLYPLQTFSKDKNIDFQDVPILIEANSIEFEEQLIALALNSLSNDVRKISAKQRKKIHLAAVIACNFTTQLWAESESILKEEDMDLSILIPLIKETISKIQEVGPKPALTGPAKRKDVQVIAAHLNMLEGVQKEIYELITQRILND